MDYYRGENGKRVKMTQEEVDAMLAEQAAMQAQEAADRAKQEKDFAKRQDMIAKGWVDPESFLDDMAERGADVVLAERKAIVDKHK